MKYRVLEQQAAATPQKFRVLQQPPQSAAEAYAALPWEIDGPEPTSASGGLPAPSPEYWGMSNQAIDFLTMGLSPKLNAAGMGLLDAAGSAIGGGGWNYSDNYNKWLEWQRENQRLYNEQNPVKSAIGTAAGVGLGITQMPTIGRGLLGAAGTGAVYGGVSGMGQDADTIPERAENTALGAVTGGLIGGGGYGLGSLAARGVSKAGDVITAMRAPPETKAMAQVYKAADEVAGPYNAMSLSRRLNDLGPDAINADVLGLRGLGLGRGAANINPKARETLESIVQARKAGQNIRLATDIETASGLPVGNTKNVYALKADAYSKVRPEIDAVYTAARAAGKDMPLQFFDDVLGTAQGKAVLNEARKNVVARARLKGTPNDVSNLAIIDEMKKIFDSRANAAARSGDNATAGLWSDFAKNLRTRADAIMDQMEDPIYATARQLRRDAYKADEAFDLGAELGGNRVGLGVPQKVDQVAESLRPNVAKGYGATKVESLLNKGAGEGTVNELMRPQARQASKAALGKKDAVVERGLNREKTFNVTNRELLGNSSTARQLSEMAQTGIGTTTAGLFLGYDPTTSGIAGGLAALGRRAAPTITRKLVSDNQRAVAPYIASLLSQHGIPTTQAIPVPQLTQFLERVATAGDAKMAKTLALMWNNEVQNTNRQTNPAR